MLCVSTPGVPDAARCATRLRQRLRWPVRAIRSDCHFGETTIATCWIPAAEEDRAQALTFLVHFVADIHNPLHARDNHDRDDSPD
jgi:hypothetical protein